MVAHIVVPDATREFSRRLVQPKFLLFTLLFCQIRRAPQEFADIYHAPQGAANCALPAGRLLVPKAAQALVVNSLAVPLRIPPRQLGLQIPRCAEATVAAGIGVQGEFPLGAAISIRAAGSKIGRFGPRILIWLGPALFFRSGAGGN